MYKHARNILTCMIDVFPGAIGSLFFLCILLSVFAFALIPTRRGGHELWQAYVLIDGVIGYIVEYYLKLEFHRENRASDSIRRSDLKIQRH